MAPRKSAIVVPPRIDEGQIAILVLQCWRLS